MATLNNAPTPKQFANAWTRGFAKAVRDAAGSDGRLSKNEAASIAEMPGALSKYADNASNYLERTGQKSVSVNKLIGKGHDYAFAVADKVAGRGNRVSLLEARMLPDDIKGDFMALRGKAERGKLTGSQLTDKINEVAKDAVFISEGDDEARAIRAANPGDAKIDGGFVMSHFSSVIDAMFYDDDATLTTQTANKADSKAFLADLATADPEAGDYYHESAAAFAKVKSVLEENLTDITYVQVGPADDDGSLQDSGGTYGLFVVGKTEDGEVAGIVMEAAWT